MTAATALLLSNAAATWVMVGVIWFVQRVHYPLFDRFDRGTFPATEAEHQSRTFGVVAVPMVVELVTSVALLVVRPPGVPAWQVWAGAIFVGVWGVSTAAVQVPLHNRLANGYDPHLHRLLVRTNWVRTAAWTARGLLCGWMIAGVMEPGA